MNFLTRPLIEGPPSFSLPPTRFVRDPRAEITLTTNEDLVSPDALDIPITRWDHKLPSTREDWYMLWPLHLVHGRSFCDPYNREHPIPEDFPQVAPNFWQMLSSSTSTWWSPKIRVGLASVLCLLSAACIYQNQLFDAFQIALVKATPLPFVVYLGKHH